MSEVPNLKNYIRRMSSGGSASASHPAERKTYYFQDADAYEAYSNEFDKFSKMFTEGDLVIKGINYPYEEQGLYFVFGVDAAFGWNFRRLNPEVTIED